MKAVNQCIGRAIRHSEDYACILLVDARYERSSVNKQLPHWISQQLQVCRTFGPTFAAVRKVGGIVLFLFNCVEKNNQTFRKNAKPFSRSFIPSHTEGGFPLSYDNSVCFL